MNMETWGSRKVERKGRKVRDARQPAPGKGDLLAAVNAAATVSDLKGVLGRIVAALGLPA